MKVLTSVALSLVTDRLFSKNGLQEIQEFLNKFTGHDVFTHDVIRFTNHVKPILISQHPFLADIDPKSINHETVWDVLSSVESVWGKELEVTEIPSSQIFYMNPLESLEFAAPGKQVSVFTPNS
jgi:hypothetical protein